MRGGVFAAAILSCLVILLFLSLLFDNTFCAFLNQFNFRCKQAAFMFLSCVLSLSQGKGRTGIINHLLPLYPFAEYLFIDWCVGCLSHTVATASPALRKIMLIMYQEEFILS